ncbi:hypothetical protein [Natronorubrum aibiense]|uniref:Uncharacterized protein n=1 Tax=Natronorubrum aibiense TaxID=348826 RepID=A0A5P9P5H6_9EURY|nr:hypothetical protein [Natronorubrum aibiense]QFU83372.1 hypothetical protein GCU68_12900 [Natronorubrum aibiense]
MNGDSKWDRYLPQKAIIFLKAYTSTLLFKISPLISTIFWISSAIVNKFSKAIPHAGMAYLSLVTLALGSIILPSLWFYQQNRPFHIFLTWTPAEPEAVDRRLKHKELVRIRDAENGGANPCAIIHVYVDKKVGEYELKIDAKGPLKAKPSFAPAESKHEDGNKIVCQNVETHDFYFPLEIEEVTGHEGGELNRYVHITDERRNGRRLLELEIL